MKRIALAALAAGCLATDAAAQDAVAEARDSIVSDLLSGDRGRVNASLGHLPMFAYDTPFPDGYVTVELVEALVAALEHELWLHKESTLDPYLELILGLLEAVAATRHPLTIDVLTRMAWVGRTDALLHFGPGVLPGAAALAVSPEATPDEAEGAMRVLWFALKRWGPGQLGAEAHDAIKGAAILHLEGPPDHFASTAEFLGSRFDKAVEIARLLGDPELTAVARKARHPTTGEPGIPPP
ncbi:MAG: hypothetical protein OXQ94_13245 [Gemmatimonadota bacterium]|nr:hypothetical protein [Gemmatimonadota bacterium]MDE2872639.1 hypothetical protein [Gemmatimonadota bacterium]